MTNADSDRNLLFGVLALQADAITRSQFVDGCALWASQKEHPLADLLVERGWLSPDDRADVERLVERKIKRHEGDVQASLAELTSDAVQQSLAGILDPVVRRSLGLPDPPTGHVLVSTIGYQPGRRERYTLTRLHAKGGIGQVWLARDEALGREVALKELRAEKVNHPAVWARFLEEARITGQLEHPNIVPVHELSGASESGAEEEARAPFYTMRFVKGRTLADAAGAYHARRSERKAGPLELHELLQAFVGVCHAVAYAHSRGVIHRDLKGQNVVLGDFGEVVVLDWGLAKVVGRPDETLTPPVALEHPGGRDETIQGQVLGTPVYMSPEQAEGRWDHVDHRTDVYGLGAILYEILCGRPPFDGSDTVDILRRVVTEPPRRPRSACDTVPLALEAVCLKALAKQPADRYPTAALLAAEVKRWMADEPVLAYRDPFATRAGRWARRHRPLVAGAAALVVATVVGLFVGTILLSRANARTEDQRARAEANFQKAREAVDEYFTKVSESKLLNVPGLQPLRKELLESARKYYQRFLTDRGQDRSVRAEAAEAWYRVGFVTMYLDSGREALEAFRHAADMYDRLARDHPSFEHYTYKLAMCLNDLGNEQAGLGLEADARRSHERCLALRRQIVRDHPDVPEYQKELGIGYGVWAARQYAAGLISESLASELKAREVFERLVRQHSDVADYSHRLSGTLQDIGGRLGEVGRTDEALTALREALSVSERLNRDHPEVLDHQTNLAACHSAIGWLCYRLTDRPEESLASYVESRAIYVKIVRDNPELKPHRLYLATLDQQVARVLMRLGRKDEALRYYNQALEVQEADVRANSSAEWSRRDLGYCHFEIGRLHAVAGRGAQASASWQKALTIFEALAESNALDPYNLACAQAICASLVGAGKATLSPAEETRRARYAERAVATLSKAADGGLQSLSMVASDPDFDAIRSRDDFQSLVAGLKAKSQARATPTPVAGEEIGVTRP